MKIYRSMITALLSLYGFQGQAQVSSLATMHDIKVEPLTSPSPELERYEITAEVELGPNHCVAEDSEVSLEFEIVETVAEVYALRTRRLEKACSFFKDGPIFTTASITVTIDPTRSLDILLRQVQSENGVATVSFRDFLPEPLNQYCDPIGTMYLGGTPLFNERTGERISLETYLAEKGLNLQCEAL